MAVAPPTLGSFLADTLTAVAVAPVLARCTICGEPEPLPPVLACRKLAVGREAEAEDAAAADAVDAVFALVDNAADGASVNELARTGDGPSAGEREAGSTGEPGAGIAADERPMKLPPREPLDAPLALLPEAALAMTDAALPLLLRAGAPVVAALSAGGAAPPCFSAY